MSLQSVPNLLNNIFSSIKSRPFSKLYFQTESANWVLNWEQEEIKKIALGLNIPAACTQGIGLVKQSVMYNSKYILLKPRRYLYLTGRNKIAFPYFHGNPSSGNKTAISCFQGLKECHEKINRIQVSHSVMHDIVLDSGIDSTKVYRIPIAVNPDFFHFQTTETKKRCRDLFDIPQQAVVVGSFQKDGNGWNEGYEPKVIKGPDVFLKTIAVLKESISELFVLISGPARGYVKRGLERLKIPYKHIFLNHYPDIDKLYQCLDLYVVSSREEGGPKAVLESMISGVALVTTRVGQAIDLVEHKKNGCMVDVENYEGLAYWGEKILSDVSFKTTLVKNGLITANENTYLSHRSQWKDFFKGFVQVDL